MLEKILNTRLQLKYDEYANWMKTEEAGKGANLVLKKGEIGFCAVPAGSNEATTAPTVLFKVGDGTTDFAHLKWGSALAADVYSWAKKSEEEFTAWVKGLVDIGDIDLSNYYNKGQVDGLLSQNSAADQKYAKDYADSLAGNYDAKDTAKGLIEALDVADTAVAGKYVSAVSETDGKISVTREDLPTYTLAEGSVNGTVKFNGTDVAVHGLQDAAYATVASLNATAKGYADAVEAKLPTSANYGVLSVAAGDETITIGGTAQNPTIAVTANKFDTYGAAAAVLGTDADAEGAQTVHGANKLAAAAKARIDAFIDGTAEAESAIDTLVEIQNFMTSDTGAFVALSGKVTNIENGTTHTVAKSLDDAAVAQVKAIKIDDADKLDGHDSEYFATAASVNAIPGTIDSKITAYNSSKNFGDIITHNVSEFATSAQGSTADSALQSVKVLGTTLTKTSNELTVDTAKTALGLKSAAYTESSAYATSAQGAKADSAVQGVSNVANNGLIMSKSADNKVSVDWDSNVVFVFNCGNASTYVD